MPWPSPKQDLAIEALWPGARRALYAIFVSACGNIELHQLNNQHVQLLAFYNMCDAYIPMTVTVSPDLVYVFSQFKSQEDVPINSAALFIQQSFMLMAIRIKKNDQGNMVVNRIRRGILSRLPESSEPTLLDILNCLINCI
ncbi:hypothetical protein BDV18DRAFT_155040 [Aspergillus unguis]